MVAAATRVPSWADLWGTAYGQLVLVKLAAVSVVGVFGLVHRRRTLPDLAAGRPRSLLRLAVVELAVMAGTLGVAAALSTTAPPV